MGNFVGALIFVFLLKYSNMVVVNDAEGVYTYLYKTIKDIAHTKVNLTFTEALFRGILCNILVSVAVYITYAGKTVSSKILAIYIPIVLFVITAFEHSVANMFILPLAYVLESGSFTLSQMFFNNLIPVTIGNIIGGAVIIPIAYYFVYIKQK